MWPWSVSQLARLNYIILEQSIIRAMVVGGQRNAVCFLATFPSLFIISLLLTNGEAFDYPSIAKPRVSWTCNVLDSYWDSRELTMEPIFVNGNFVCGFYCKVEENNTCLFAVSVFDFNSIPHTDLDMVWSANRSNPVGRGAKLQLSQQGDLMLQNVDSTLIRSTNTARKSVSGMKLSQPGNLMLFDGNEETVWQSFDHLTDSLVLGQRLVSGQKLVASMSDTNWSEGIYTFLIDNNGYFVACAELDASIVYYQSNEPQLISQTGRFYAGLTNKSFGVGLSPGYGVCFIQLGCDGHLCVSHNKLHSERDDWFWNLLHQCDHPTDCLVSGQSLVSGQKLKSNISATEWVEGLFSFLIDNRGFFVASVESDANLVYYRSPGSSLNCKIRRLYGEFTSTSFGAGLSPGLGFRFMGLSFSRYFRRSGWVELEWKVVHVLFQNPVPQCDYPLACGKYGICSVRGCDCPELDENGTAHFKPMNPDQPDLGCSPYGPISCNSRFLEINKVSCSALLRPNNSHITDGESCKQTCLNDRSCKYATFESNGFNSSSGWCSFGSEALSFKREADTNYSLSVFLKVQNSSTEQIPHKDLPSPRKRRQNVGVILGSTFAATFSVLLICTLLLRQSKNDPKDVEQDYLGHISGTSTRFSYEELKVITNNFSNKLGEGGFGCVFQGTLPGSTQVAVKCLDGFGPVKKSFIAEVETMGSINHFNVVQLVGFCAEKLRMLLVYEYMCNGSLDQWIFCRDKVLLLGWQCRRKIIVDIAKGLAYLHEGCRQKIIHLDIKPQNILLDENFNAKVSDFGLSKLVGREQSQIVTTMRGTPGYMAPEWLNSVITEKIDVYSFGIVVLEILCGRKNVDRSLPEEDVHLVSHFKRKVEDGELLDLVDKYNEEMQSHAAEAVEIMKVAACCLQGEYARRPSMSIVLKFLQGKMEGENEYDFSNPAAPAEVETLVHQTSTAALIPSVLSGPR